ncbi:MAG: PAS domain S-box protein, partial [Candidatus Cloacimonetes bacterium]|nr:PAS domain S-box protein [Candidatus Cloacimonadota bacterium]
DITERKKTEKALQTSEERFRQFFANSPEYCFIISLEGTILDINKSALKALGYLKKEIVGKPLLTTIYTPSSQEKAQNLFVKWRTVGGLRNEELNMITKDGKERTVLLSVDAIRGTKGEIIYSILAQRDITERKQAEEALHESEEKYRQLFTNIGEGVALVDLEENFVYCNPATEKIFGVPSGKLVGRNLNEFLSSQKFEVVKNQTSKRKTGEKSIYELEIIRPDRKKRQLLITATPQFDKERNVIGAFGIVRDITESKQAEEEIKEKSIELEKQFNKSEKQRITTLSVLSDLNQTTKELQIEIKERKQAEEQIKQDLEEKSILLQEVHHRVKNNMQIISSLLKLQSAHIKDKRTLELFQNSQDRVKTMSLIHDALYRSKDLAHIDFTDYVRKLTTQIFISYGANSNFIKFKIDIKDVLLDISTAIPCGLIINELVSNSIKYAFPKGSKGEISISFTYKDQVHTLCVKDNGIGISGEIDLENSPTLGLMLVNSLTKQLDGTLKLEKVKGTSFKITFKKIELKTYGKVES